MPTTPTWDPIVTAFAGVVLGAVLGGVISYVVQVRLVKRARKTEERDVASALYQELADRAARCLNDYIAPWYAYQADPGSQTEMEVNRAGRFRPAEPVVYPNLAGKLGLIKHVALGRLLHFYFRLDALRRDIDRYSGAALGERLPTGGSRKMAQRLGETLGPALKALQELGEFVPMPNDIDAVAASQMPNVAKRFGKDLRGGLEEMADEAHAQAEAWEATKARG